MIGEKVVGNGDGCGTMDDINKAISTTSKEAMIDPYIRGVKYINTITIRAPTMPHVARAVLNYARLSGLAIMNANPMYDNMANMLYGDARPVCYFHFCPSPIYGLVTIYHKFIPQFYNHASREHDPQWL